VAAAVAGNLAGLNSPARSTSLREVRGQSGSGVDSTVKQSTHSTIASLAPSCCRMPACRRRVYPPSRCSYRVTIVVLSLCSSRSVLTMLAAFIRAGAVS
jgi:hypothetical protein